MLRVLSYAWSLSSKACDGDTAIRGCIKALGAVSQSRELRHRPRTGKAVFLPDPIAGDAACCGCAAKFNRLGSADRQEFLDHQRANSMARSSHPARYGRSFQALQLHQVVIGRQVRLRGAGPVMLRASTMPLGQPRPQRLRQGRRHCVGNRRDAGRIAPDHVVVVEIFGKGVRSAR